MYAVIVSGGKQYRVTQGQTLKLEKLDIDAGQEINFDKVLMIKEGDTTHVGSPFLSGSKINAMVVEHGRHPKVKIIKFRRRKHHMKRMGHRQHYTAVKITAIQTGA